MQLVDVLSDCDEGTSAIVLSLIENQKQLEKVRAEAVYHQHTWHRRHRCFHSDGCIFHVSSDSFWMSLKEIRQLFEANGECRGSLVQVNLHWMQRTTCFYHWLHRQSPGFR